MIFSSKFHHFYLKPWERLCWDVQGDQKVSVHVRSSADNTIITTRLSCLTTWLNLTAWQGQGDTILTLTPSVIPDSNYVIMVSD
jgi:hypothetical protein